MIKSFRDLLVWQKGMRLAKEVYQVTTQFPKEEKFGLTSQLRRCAVSVPSNIAEGFGRQKTGDYTRFLSISRGSLFELQTQLELSRDLGLLSVDSFDRLESQAQEIGKMLSSLISKIREPKN